MALLRKLVIFGMLLVPLLFLVDFLLDRINSLRPQNFDSAQVELTNGTVLTPEGKLALAGYARSD